MKKSPIACVDIDGVLTRDPYSRYSAFGPVGGALWWGLQQTGIAERIMREAVPDVLAREWLRILHDLGLGIDLLTARLEQRGKVTTEWVDHHQFTYDTITMRKAGVSVVEHKLAVARRSKGCVLLIDDTHEICREVAKQGDDAPVVIECTDWRIVATVLPAVLTALGYAAGGVVSPRTIKMFAGGRGG